MKSKKLNRQRVSQFYTLMLVVVGLGIGFVLSNTLVHFLTWIGWINTLPTFMEVDFFATFGTLSFSVSDLIIEIGGQYLIPVYTGIIWLILLIGTLCTLLQLRKIFNNIEQKKLFFTTENEKSFGKIMKITAGFGFAYISFQMILGSVLWGYLLDATMEVQGEFWMTFNFSEWIALALLMSTLQGFYVIFKRGIELQQEQDDFI